MTEDENGAAQPSLGARSRAHVPALYPRTVAGRLPRRGAWVAPEGARCEEGRSVPEMP